MTYAQTRKASAEKCKEAAKDAVVARQAAMEKATKDAAETSKAKVAATQAAADAQKVVSALRTKLGAVTVKAEAAGLADELEAALVALADARGLADHAARADARAARSVARAAAELAAATAAKARVDAEAAAATAATEATKAALAAVGAEPARGVREQAQIALKKPTFKAARDALGAILDGAKFSCAGAEWVSTRITDSQIADVYGTGVLGLCRYRAREAAERVQFALSRAAAATSAHPLAPTPADQAAAVQQAEADLEAVAAHLTEAANQFGAIWSRAQADLVAIKAAARVSEDAQKGIDNHRETLISAKVDDTEKSLFRAARDWRSAAEALDDALLAQLALDPQTTPEPSAAEALDDALLAQLALDPQTTHPEPSAPISEANLAKLLATEQDKRNALTQQASDLVALHNALATFQAAVPEPIMALVLRLFAVEQSIAALVATSVESLEGEINAAEAALTSAREPLVTQAARESRRAATRRERAAVLADALTAAPTRLFALVAANEQSLADVEADAVMANYLADPLVGVTP